MVTLALAIRSRRLRRIRYRHLRRVAVEIRNPHEISSEAVQGADEWEVAVATTSQPLGRFRIGKKENK
jgi:hypothetical protein